MPDPNGNQSVIAARGFVQELGIRVHGGTEAAGAESGPRAPVRDLLDVLSPQSYIGGSAFAEHLKRLRQYPHSALGDGDVPSRVERSPGWTYDPDDARRAVAEEPWVSDSRFSAWTRACGEMAENGIAMLADVVACRQDRDIATGPGWESAVRARPVRVRADQDRAGEIFALARSGANEGQTTKSLLGPCPHPAWRYVTGKYGLKGVNALPVVTIGTHGTGLLTQTYTNWKQDYVTFLDLMFYLEYNIDTIMLSEAEINRMMTDLCRAMDFPGLPYDLQVRRLHMACGMAFFDAKRKYETLFSEEPTDGRTAWVFRDRDQWRDFKAMDSAVLGQYISFVEGTAGRDDLMLTGHAHDWVDLGPDLRNSECGQSVLTLTRGSITCQDLLRCYERTVWLLNAQWTQEGDIKPGRYAACVYCGAVGTWAACDHRHDIWRYYSLAADAYGDAMRRDLYKACQLADCYSEDMSFREPAPGACRVSIPRSALPFDVRVAGQRHTGEVEVHEVVVQAVRESVLPMSLVATMFIISILLRDGRITPSAFLAHMDAVYCQNAAALTESLHAGKFNRAVGNALCALVMEQWWNGMYYAIGLGSLIEAQPGRVGRDRAAGSQRGADIRLVDRGLAVGPWHSRESRGAVRVREEVVH
jgi:hypothetical protein